LFALLHRATINKVRLNYSKHNTNVLGETTAQKPLSDFMQL